MTCCNSGFNDRIIPPFIGFTEYTPEIPKLYFSVKSQEQRLFAICGLLNKVICYADMLADKANDHELRIDELERLFEQFMASGFNDYYADQIEQWVKDNMPWIMEKACKNVYFGLTLDGYFVAYIPENWNELVFDTGMVYGEDTYGRLILRWDVDNSQGEVNQRPEQW